MIFMIHQLFCMLQALNSTVTKQVEIAELLEHTQDSKFQVSAEVLSESFW